MLLKARKIGWTGLKRKPKQNKTNSQNRSCQIQQVTQDSSSTVTAGFVTPACNSWVQQLPNENHDVISKSSCEKVKSQTDSRECQLICFRSTD